MTRLLRSLVFLVAGCVATADAQNTIFNDSLTADVLNPAVYPAVTPSSTGWVVLSNKSVPASSESGGALTINMAGTSSGFIETQALFAAAPVQLLPGTYIELTTTFVPTFILTNSSDNLIVGLFNSGGSAPLSGLANSGLSNALTTFATGGAKAWLGYNANIPFTGASPKVLTRPAQTGSNNTVQDVVVDGQSSSVGYTAPAGTSASSIGAMSTTLTNGSTYTLNYRLSLSADGLTLTSAVSLYNGTGTSGTGANSLIGSYTGKFATVATIITKAFDALAIGWRADAGTSSPSNLTINALTVKTTGGKPWFVAQPPDNVAVSIGSDLNLDTTVGGIVTSYQWQVSTDGGSNFVNLDTATNPSAATPSLALTNVQYAAAGLYRLVTTNAAGSSLSTNCAVTVSATPVAPSISTNPMGATVLGGTSYTFKVVVNGTSPLTYQWEYSPDNTAFTSVGGATSSSYTIPAVSLSDEGYYRVTVSNVAGTITSSAAHLIVNQPLTITVQPQGAALALGESYTLTATAVGKPAPTYQWYLNGGLIGGATNSTYTIASASAANAGIYTVVAGNSVGDSVTSSGAAVAVISPTLTTTAAIPASASAGILPDARLSLTFNQPISVGMMGTIKIFDAANPTTPVDTIDLIAATAQMKTLRTASTLSTLALPVQTKSIGGISGFNYYPITVSGNTATIYPRNGVLTYGKTYFVTVDPGVFTEGTGLAYAGITGNAGWTFSTKVASPLGSTTQYVVAADGSGDFYTVQGALDIIPANNTTPRTILVRNGSYFEQVAFQSKHFVSILGENSDQTVIVYPNNNNFNSLGGVYHRATFLANSVHDFTLANLTINNTTPQNGTQAEAIVIGGTGAATAHNLVTRCKFYSYQDTVQFNKQTYVSDSTIYGDVDFMWGDGPAFFENCDIRILRTAGYFTQIRNGSGNHGYVFVNCRFTAPAGINGTFLGRIDPNAASFPYSEVVVLNSKFGDATNNAFLATATGVSGSNYLAGWWLLNNATSAAAAPNVHNWSNSLVNSLGAPLANPNADTFTTMPLDATTQANYRNVTWVLNTSLAGTVNGSWTPALAPVIVVPPASQTANVGEAVTFTVTALAIPAPTYQWRKNGAPIGGATNASYTIGSVTGGDADTYDVVVTNSGGVATSAPATLLVNGGPPIITQNPVSQSAFAGTNVSFSVFAIGSGPFTYQWFKDGSPVNDATGSALLLANVQSADAGSYSVTVSNAGGADISNAATFSLATPAAGVTPTLPTIPTNVFLVTNYGAIGDGVTDNTAAIAATVTAAKNAGGGIVEFPAAASAYLSGPIALSSNINLQIDGGAMLKALPFGTYPNPNVHFITFASGSSNVAITGNGVIDGNGAPWWTAYDSGAITQRPRLIQFTKASNVLISGVTFQNSPNFNLAFSGANTNVTIFGASVLAPGDSPNTDGMDLAGTNFLVQNCYVSVGDDNVVAKPGGAFCSNIVVANCSFGTGHGVSIGGQTNVGLDGMLVTNCTFDGTSSALRFKADPTQGGPVQNVTFTNLTMKNVQYPILFYSYYNQLGSPGAVSGSSQTTPAKVNAWNTTPPNSLASSTIPTWKNITVSNLTVINGSGYSTIWGLPLADALIANVTLNNVTIQGGAGLELYDATNIQLTGTNSVGPIVTCNALAITGQPTGQTVTAGDNVTFSGTAVGGSGTNNTGLTYQWNRDGVPLTNGLQADGSNIAGATTATLALTNARVTNAGQYTLTVSTTLDGYNVATSSLVANSLPVSATSSVAVLNVNPIAGTIALSNLTYTYDGNVKAPTATTSPTGLAVQFSYANNATPLNAGSYPVTATFVDPNYSGSASDTLVINPAPATVTLGALAQTYTGQPLTPTVTTIPANLPVAITYAGDSTAPTNAGSYAVVATVSDSNYTGGDSQTFVINRATPVIVVTPYSVIYDTQPHTATGSATGVLGEALAGLDLSATQHTVVGNYTDSWSFTDVTGNYTNDSGNITDAIAKAVAVITLHGLEQRYDGTPRIVTATTLPAVSKVDITYDGKSDAPIYPGSYVIVATIDDANYKGTASDTLNVRITALVRHMTTLSGSIEGSVQVLTAENSSLNNGAMISGDMLVRGTPSLVLNGNPTYVSTLDGPGAVASSNYTVTLNGSVLRHLVRRIDPLALPTVAASPQPTGTRNVSINNSTQSAGDFATLRNLTLNSKVGLFAIPAGTYGDFTANRDSGFILGVAGGTEPAIYNLQSLTLNGGSRLEIVGPVILTLANGTTISKDVTTSAHVFDWFTLQIASGGLTINGSLELPAIVIAPTGTVSLNGTSSIAGDVYADKLVIGSNAFITEPAQ